VRLRARGHRAAASLAKLRPICCYSLLTAFCETPSLLPSLVTLMGHGCPLG
jgi:hypothetical protein